MKFEYSRGLSPLIAGFALSLFGCSGSDSASRNFSAADSNERGSDSSQAAPSGSNVNLGGSQDFGYFRDQIQNGQVPKPESLDAAGFFAEHHNELPPPSCGNRICVEPMLGVMGNLIDGSNCTMLQLALSSTVAADPSQRPPLSLAVVVDVSGSMLGEKIQFVREGLNLLIDGMRDSDELAIVTYSSEARVDIPLTEVAGSRVELRRAADSLVAEGATNLYDGLELGYHELSAEFDPARQNRVILLSDGVPTAGISGTDSILDMSRGYNSDGIGLTSIGLGADFNLELMRGLALQADGNFYFLEDPGAVDEVFVEELSYFTVPVAYDLELSVRAGDSYNFGRALGSPLWKNSGTGGSLEVPSVFVAHRQSHTDVTEAGGRRGGGSQLLLELMPLASAPDEPNATIATVDVSFRDPTSNETVSDTIEVDYPFAPRKLQETGFFEAHNLAAVHKSFVMLNIFVGMERAAIAFHRGTANLTTIQELDNLIAAVEDYNEEIGDTDIDSDLQLLRSLRRILIDNGVPSGEPIVSENPWPAD